MLFPSKQMSITIEPSPLSHNSSITQHFSQLNCCSPQFLPSLPLFRNISSLSSLLWSCLSLYFGDFLSVLKDANTLYDFVIITDWLSFPLKNWCFLCSEKNIPLTLKNVLPFVCTNHWREVQYQSLSLMRRHLPIKASYHCRLYSEVEGDDDVP